jgi:hypothetical protein
MLVTELLGYRKQSNSEAELMSLYSTAIHLLAPNNSITNDSSANVCMGCHKNVNNAKMSKDKI